MDAAAISVRGLGKRYRIGAKQEPYKRLTETLSDLAKAPLRRLTRIGKPLPEEQVLWALKDVSFDIQPGEVVGVIGRNGAGKSTLLKILSRITEPTEGEITIRGRVASLLEVGTGFHPELTGRENIFLNGTILGMRKHEISAKFDEIVAFSEIGKFLDTPVKRYSSGMYVRLAFAVAAHLDPEILLVDEVLAVGDAQFQKKCLGKMSDVAAGGRTVLFVSHNMGAIKRLCREAIWLSPGENIVRGDCADVVNKYLQQGAATEPEVDLRQHENRVPKSTEILRAASLVNKDHQLQKEFAPDETMCLRIEYSFPDSIKAAGIGFLIHSVDGTLLSNTNTYMLSKAPYSLPAQGVIVFHINAPHFNPGAYFVTISAGSAPNKVEDKIERALSFSILSGDVYGNGFLMRASDGIMPLRATYAFQ